MLVPTVECAPPSRYRDMSKMQKTPSATGFLAALRTAAGQAAPTGPRRISAKTTVPGYEIVEELGRGGMGIVFKACQLKLNRVVALKMILADFASNPDAVKRFYFEAEAVARLSHTNIVQIHEVGEADGR